MKNKRLLHPKEAAYELGVSTKTIHRWDAAGKLRAVRTVGNQRRRGMKKLLALGGQPAVDVVLIDYPDRLVRFGFGYLEQAFAWRDVRLEVLDPPKHQGPTEELIEDLLTLVAVFAGRRYGHRATGVRTRVETVRKRM
jgi:putative resolvase